MRGLTALFAHPDDETFATGGDAGPLRGRRGARARSTAPPTGMPDDRPASPCRLGPSWRRCAATSCAPRARCSASPPWSAGATRTARWRRWIPTLVISEIVRLIRRERPASCSPSAPRGRRRRHRDHRAISRLATAAFLLADTTTAYPEQLAEGLAPHRADRLCYVTWPVPAPGIRTDHRRPADRHQHSRAGDWLPRKRAGVRGAPHPARAPRALRASGAAGTEEAISWRSASRRRVAPTTCSRGFRRQADGGQPVAAGCRHGDDREPATQPRPASRSSPPG